LVLVSGDVVDGIRQLIVSHPQTLPVPKLGNHTQSTVLNMVTGFDILHYPPHSKLDIPPRHQPPRKQGGQQAVPPTDHLKLDPKVKLVALDEFVLMRAIPIPTHRGILASLPGQVPNASNSISVLAGWCVHSEHLAKL
jgi:hypothetical protein